MVVVINGDVASASFITLHGKNIGESEKKDIVTNIDFETMVHSIKRQFFHRRMVHLVNKLESSDKKYHTNRNVRDENY